MASVATLYSLFIDYAVDLLTYYLRLFPCVQFRAVIEGGYSPVVFTKDIYVGTVPLCMKDMKSCVAGMFNQPYLNSSEELLGGGVTGGGCGGRGTGSQLSLTEILAAAVTAASAADPSAPCLTILEPPEVPLDTENHLAAVEDRPPPFAPGHEELLPESPSAPSAQMLLYPWTEDGQSEIWEFCCSFSFDYSLYGFYYEGHCFHIKIHATERVC